MTASEAQAWREGAEARLLRAREMVAEAREMLRRTEEMERAARSALADAEIDEREAREAEGVCDD
jgi:hypothetical protein